MLPNAPNPFNPHTTIHFELLAGALVSLVVFDISGRVVHTLISGDYHSAGAHQVAWDGRDDSGRSVSTGVYLHKLQTPTECETRRMLLLKGMLRELAGRLKTQGSEGLSFSNLKNFRQVTFTWPNLPIGQTMSGFFGEQIGQTVSGLFGEGNRQMLSIESEEKEVSQTSSDSSILPELVHFPSLQSKTPEFPWRDEAWTTRLFMSLSFSHLLELARLDELLKRAFYELECIKSGWSVRDL